MKRQTTKPAKTPETKPGGKSIYAMKHAAQLHDIFFDESPLVPYRTKKVTVEGKSVNMKVAKGGE